MSLAAMKGEMLAWGQPPTAVRRSGAPQSEQGYGLATTALKLIGLAMVFLLLTALPAFSQNCALCYTQAASAGARMIQALKSGILILIIPPTLGSIGMIFIVHHKRNQVRRIDDGDQPGSDWKQDW